MHDVIIIRLKRKDERRSWKGNPKKRDGFDVFYDVTHKTFRISYFIEEIKDD